MRSSNKSRSRNKNGNRSRSMGNIVNRVFDSSGPEGRVRGTPQQIIDKYEALARDAQLAGDRVATENFQQHSEHYSRMLGEAQRENAERQEQQQQHQPRQYQNDRNDQPNERDEQPREPMNNGAEKPKVDVGDQVLSSLDVADDEHENALVDTPENVAPKPSKPRTRRPSESKSNASDADTSGMATAEGGEQPPVGQA
jgi:Domain of unknown function (DUF4167)